MFAVWFGGRGCLLRGEIIGVFGIFFKFEVVGLGDVAEFAVPQDVAPDLLADGIIAVVAAGKGELGKAVVVVRDSVFQTIGYIKNIAKIGAFGDVIDESEVLGADVAC